MKANEFRGIFERFSNLNLIVLIEDMKRGTVVKDRWIESLDDDCLDLLLCPLSHGMKTFVMDTLDFPDCLDKAANDIGCSEPEAKKFVNWWDGRGGHSKDFERRYKSLFDVLLNVLAERQADADAVQAVCGSPSLTEVAGR